MDNTFSANKKMKRVLIANRGEIALRVKRAALKLGITPVMLSSEADRQSRHAGEDVEVLWLKGSAAQETYLNAQRIVELAKEAKCDGVHPGYGFLSENAEFAELVTSNGMKFIGPSAEVIALMGDKLAAKAVAKEAGVPMASSVEVKDPAIALKKIESEVGFPVLLKAKAGGGGRGMRLVRDAKLFQSECERAQAEALKYFGNGTVFAERYIDCPRHVEVQVFGDGQGVAYHLGTRDCSTQRRHQKLVEEAPAPFLSEAIRDRLHSAAVALAERVRYEGAGTVEFLVHGEEIFFLEMNTRIQVEHPVTEEIYGIDLVEWQFRVAAGERLDRELFTKAPCGHAIEFRIYAEDPKRKFSPALGTLTLFSVPNDPFLREEGWVESGTTVTPYYDAMLTKLIVRGRTRDEALRESRRILKLCRFEGVQTTLLFHLWLLHESSFSTCPFEIGFLDHHFVGEALKNVSLYERIDPEHLSAKGSGHVPLEFIRVEDSSGAQQVIRIVHRRDGLFEGRIEEGARQGTALISQTKAGVLEALQSSSTLG